MISQKVKANAALFSGGIFFGISSPLARLMGTWLHPLSVVCIRFIFALPFALLFLKKKSFKNISLQKMLPVAFFFPLSVCLYTFSLFYTKVSLSIFSFYIANILSSIFVGYVFNKEKMSKNKSIGLVLSLIAIFIFTNPFRGFSMDTGMILGYASGIVATIASLFQKRVAKVVDERLITVSQIVGGIVVSLVAIIFLKDLSIFSISLWGLFLGAIFGFLFFLINYLIIYGFKRVEIGIGTILLSSELVFGPIAAYFIFGERLTALEILGAVLIILATVFVSRHTES